jgi:tetratricopeptide (TPR) repeat protein
MASPTVGPAGPPAWPAFAFPAAVSLCLSAASVGSHPYWQDSSFYLIAVKEFSVLYPHGFMLYLLLCKGWTLLLGSFVNFTLAVHLFSSACAAGAAGMLGLSARRVTSDTGVGAVIGALAAAGYTWWFSGLYAKGYALYFLGMATLLWRITSGDRCRLLPILGLAWAAHPSAVFFTPAVALVLWSDRRALGIPRLLGALAAAVVAALGATLFLPAIAAHESIHSMASPRTFGEVAGYLTGSSYTRLRGVWGWSAHRWLDLPKFAAEEFLIVGGILVAAGLRKLWRPPRREFLFLGVWSLPILVVLPLFKIEGQSDLWLVPVWMALWLVAGVGLSDLKARKGWIPRAAGAAGLACAVLANGRDLQFRNETLPETYGRCYLQNLDPGAILLLSSDDALGLCTYLQIFQGFRTDVRVVNVNNIRPSGPQSWYLDALSRAWPDFPPPDFASVSLHAQTYTSVALAQASIVNAHQPGGPSVYFDRQPAPRILQGGSVVPAGFLWKWTEAPGAQPDPRAWSYPVTMNEVAARLGRRRGQKTIYGPSDVIVLPDAYEERLLSALVRARLNLASAVQREGTPRAFAESATIYEEVLRVSPDTGKDPEVLYPLGLDDFMLNRYGEAEDLFQRTLREDPTPSEKAGALFYLGELRRMGRRPEEARSLYRQALEAAPPGSPLRPELEKRLGPR